MKTFREVLARSSKNYRCRDLFVLILLMVWASVVHAGITASSHDFSGRGWGTNEICIFCHTPHNAKTVTGYNAPLWNHQVTTATYTLYTSPTLQKYPGDPPTEQPRGPSKLCLSCHDGTVALDFYGNRNGTHFISGSANIGTDLSNDHPVSIRWNHQTIDTKCDTCHADLYGFPQQYNLPFYDWYLECGTCHEPHNRYPTYSNGKMLRAPLSQSVICLYCHEK